jgi:hypothetical protein
LIGSAESRLSTAMTSTPITGGNAGDRCHASFAERDYAGRSRMVPNDFIDHLTRRGVLREATIPGGPENAPLRVTLGLRALWQRSTA